MDEIRTPEAHTHKDKDVPEILPMCALPGVVLGGMFGYYVGDVAGAILGAIVGGALGAAIAYWALNNNGAVAKDMKYEEKKD